jgi:hypothetical protein
MLKKEEFTELGSLCQKHQIQMSPWPVPPQMDLPAFDHITGSLHKPVPDVPLIGFCLQWTLEGKNFEEQIKNEESTIVFNQWQQKLLEKEQKKKKFELFDFLNQNFLGSTFSELGNIHLFQQQSDEAKEILKAISTLVSKHVQQQGQLKQKAGYQAFGLLEIASQKMEKLFLYDFAQKTFFDPNVGFFKAKKLEDFFVFLIDYLDKYYKAYHKEGTLKIILKNK